MGELTKISWCDSTWNPFIGCTRVSPGCFHCYTELTPPFRTVGQKLGDPIRLASEHTWHDPFRWNKKPWVCDIHGAFARKEDCLTGYCRDTLHRRRVFAPSLSDWLHPGLPVDALVRFLDTIRLCENLEFILCTKRPELWHDRLYKVFTNDGTRDAFAQWVYRWLEEQRPPANVWILASAEDQQRADERIPHLLKIPAVVRGLSCEPLIGEVDLCKPDGLLPHGDTAIENLDWVIVGGESGPKARPCHVEWIHSIKDQCVSAGVPCFVKQLGSDARRDLSAVIPESDIASPDLDAADIAAWEYHRYNCPMHLKHLKGGDPAEWPDDLRVRQFPDIEQRTTLQLDGNLDGVRLKDGSIDCRNI